MIGDVQGVTGWAAAGEIASWQALPFVVEEYNKAGGLLGHPIELIQKDMQSDPALSAPVTQELVDQGAQFIIAPAFPGECAGVIQTAGDNGLPVAAMNAATPSILWVGGYWCPMPLAGDNMTSAATAEYALKTGAETAFILTSPDSEYTSGGATYFAQAFEHGGGKVVGEATFGIEQQDYAVQVTEIAALNPQPDVVFKAVIIPYGATFMKQLRGAGVTSLVVGMDGDMNQYMIDAGGDAMEGMILPSHAFPEPGSKCEAYQEGLTAFLGKPTEDVQGSTYAGDMMAVIKAAVDLAGSIEPEAVRAALPEVQNAQGVNADITLKGTIGLPNKPLYVVAIENGEFVVKDHLTPSWVPEPIGMPEDFSTSD